MTTHINCTTAPITMASFNPEFNYGYIIYAKLSKYPETQKALREWYPYKGPDTFNDFEVHYLNQEFRFSINTKVIVSSFGQEKSPIRLSDHVDESRIRGALGFPGGIYVAELYVLGNKVERETEDIGVKRGSRFQALADTDLEREVLEIIKGLQKAHGK